jgi:hypothetical protein
MKTLLIAAMLIIVPCSYGQFGSVPFVGSSTWLNEGSFGFQQDLSGYLAGNWFKNWDYIRTGGFGSINHFTRFQ